MLFKSPKSAFNLEVVNYENPCGGQTREDKNLLLTYLQLVDGSCRWATIAPILYTYELHNLASWLRDILDDREVPDRLLFSEPCVSIQLSEVTPDKRNFCFQFLLLHEMTPPWWLPAIDKPYLLSVECDRSAIDQAILALSGQLSTYPIR